ncbi:hypothetical protein Tco_1241036, partial [Tanacetum coccineum]
DVVLAESWGGLFVLPCRILHIRLGMARDRVSKLEVDLALAIKAKHDKGNAKHDLDDVDLDHVDLDGRDLENIVIKLEEDFYDEGFSGNEDVVCFNDVKYPLTDAEIRMFKERPTISRALTATTFTFKASTRSRAPIASTSNAQAASTSAPRVYMRKGMTGCVLGLRAHNDPNAPPPTALRKRKSKP